MASPERQELLRNAVVFLRDPKARIVQTQSSPLAQRVQFLEAKGLTGSEIEEAMRQAAASQPVPYAPPQAYGVYQPAYGSAPYGAQPPQPWDWRDYFVRSHITAVVSGTIVYGAVALFKKYVKPHLSPPSATAYEEDRDALTAQFDAAETMLKEIQMETNTVRLVVEEQREKIVKTTQEVENVVQEMRKNEGEMHNALREMRDEVQTIKDMLPKMIDKSKETHTQSLVELQQELKSLKTLLLTRGSNGVSGATTPIIPSKPSIPPWQLAGSSHLSNGSSSSPTNPTSAQAPKLKQAVPEPQSQLSNTEERAIHSSESVKADVTLIPSSDSPAEEPSQSQSSLVPQDTDSPLSSATEARVGAEAESDEEMIVDLKQDLPEVSLAPAASTFTGDVPDGSPCLLDASNPLAQGGDEDASREVLDTTVSTSSSEQMNPAQSVVNIADVASLVSPDGLTSKVIEEDLLSGSQNQALSDAHQGADIESLQQRLKLVEQRFADVSTSFTRLQAEKAAADRVLHELTSVESMVEADGLRDFLQNLNLKTEMAQDEIKRLTGKLTRQEERIEELRDIHRLESKSQSDQIRKLRGELEEAEALIRANQGSAAHLEGQVAKQKAEVERLHVEVDKTKVSVKDEEEKRVKAVSLLKTVRQKLVKAEKERDDATKEVQGLKDKEKEEREREKVERQQLQDEIQKVNGERETAVQGLRAQFDKEVAGLRDKYEKEISALRGQYELDMITLKSVHSKETEANNSRATDLEAFVRILTTEKDDIFDQLQMRQAELESSQSHLESLQSQTVELQYQLREATDRTALLTDELAEARKEQAVKPESGPPPEEVTRLLSTAEAKYETRIADLRRRIAAVERERDEGEALFSKRLAEKAKEVEGLQALVNLSAKGREEEGENITTLQKEIESLREASQVQGRLLVELQAEAQRIPELETLAQAQVAEVKAKLTVLEQQLEESKAREAQMRAHNKTLREELRKVQSSAALLERQRNPGVGYWATRSDGSSETRSPTSSVSDLPRDSPPRPSSPSTGKSDEEVNYEYLRNVILQFLEHREMRPHLVRILSTILRFTPQETRRLIAKVSS
ncbi:uncharacterized protein PHACADRAFT_134491 [Phanerochaete carnosa HHB-10118-sp]|uniref:Peroxisomal membrane protein PEX14 n=1 Tax=Phanerochaete carnosa (strain HHB-10118-sp) TaxID=650164 RepID=K5WB38_PHACS|nr:uncharacterized protein PHACADRAFT_134491 [Phanerochaete carnosa HHB-10118-sp]EKM61178.1 hypothetical protein PHACADRAFT_134491 [Phanerochaete carnosa HHB-10118-sp]